MGVMLSTRPITGPAVRLDSPVEKLSIRKTNIIKEAGDAIDRLSGKKEVPEWVRSEAMRQLSTSYGNGLNALSAWRGNRRFEGMLDERGYAMDRYMRPSPPAPDEPGEAMVDNNWLNDGRANNDASRGQFQPAVCVGDDGTIYVAFGDELSADTWAIYFTKSTNGGESWINAILVDNIGQNERPSIACYGTGGTADVYIGYTYYYDYANYDYDVVCAVSNDGGSSWPHIWYIQNTTGLEDMSCIATDNNGYVYYAYVYGWSTGGGCDPSEAESEVLMKRSVDHGASWSSAYYLTDYGGQHDDFLPAIVAQGGGASSILHLAWTHDYTTTGDDYDVLYKKITNAGGSPSIPGSYVTISGYTADEYVIPGGIDIGSDGNPQITYIYSTAANGNGDIRYRRSYDGGTSFGSYQVISGRNTEETDPRICVDDKNNPIIVWRDARDGNPDIYMTYSDDEGTSWRGEFKANQDASYANQYWPSAGLWKDGWKRNLAVVWWDTRYDDGDIYFNGNSMTGVSLNVDYIPTAPPAPMPGFSYYSHEAVRGTTFTTPAVYRIWFDPEYANDPLLDEKWSGSGSTEQWATENPGGWTWIPASYFTPPDTGGAYDCFYYHQYRTIFNAIKGNPPTCTHTLPNIDVHYTSFGNACVDTINDAVSCTAWTDAGSAYDMTGWLDLSPVQRWATNDPDTVGTVSVARTVDVDYYHQWYPLVLFVGPTASNTVFEEQHTQFGSPHLETGLWDSWQQWTDCGTTVDFSDTTVPLGWYAIDPTSFLCEGYSSRTIRYSGNTYVVIRNDFDFGDVEVDFVTVASPDTESWGPGSVHHIGAISPQTFADTVRYYYDSWSDGGAIDHDVTVPDVDIVYTAYFNTQYKLDMTYSGETGSHIPVLTGEGWYWADSFATITASEYWDSAAGIRYGFSHWESQPPGAWFGDSASPSTTILMDKHYTAIAVYAVQFELVVASDGGYGYPAPPIGSNWIDNGVYLCAEAGSPDTISHMYATGWTGTGPVPGTGTGDMACFWMTEPGSITWHWDNQLTLEIISTFGVPSPPVGTHYYDPGDYVECTVPTPFYLSGDTRAACAGYTGTSIIGSGSGNYVDFNIVENCTLTWNWEIEYRLIVINAAGYGSPIPAAGESWHPSGSMVMARVLSPDGGMVCIGFNGTPPTLPATSPQDSVVFAMIAPTSLEWLWADGGEVYSLTVTPDTLGDPTPYGTTYWLPGSAINASVTSPYPDAGDPGIRWIADSYTGTGSCPSGPGSSTGTWFIWANSTLHWNWDDQYRLYIDSEPGYYGAPVPDTGANWYDPGTSVGGSVTSPWEDSIVCTGFTGTGSAPASSPATSFGFDLDEPSSVLWHWDISTVTLTVMSDWGTPNPPVGSHAYAGGAEVELSVNKYHYISSTERYECVGWRGLGSVPTSGTDTLVSVTLLINSTIQWLWQHQYRVDIDNPGGYDTPVPGAGQHWFDADDWVTCYITTNPVDTMYCVGYFGTGSCVSAWGMDEVSFILDAYTTIQWVWMGISDIESLIVYSDYGTPYPPVGVHYYPHGVLANCYIVDCVEPGGPGERYICDGYTGTGCAPSGSDTAVTFTMSSEATLTWNWQHQYTFEVQNPAGFGSPIPGIGIYWMNADEPVDAYITVNPDGGMVCTGYTGWGSLGTGYGDSVHFILGEPSGILWNWSLIGDTYTLEVISPYGPCDPPVGTNYIPVDVVITATAGPYGYDSEVERHAASSYTGTGCVIPPSGDTNAVTFTMISNGTITWDWIDEYYMALTYSGCGSAVPTQTGEGWYQYGGMATLTTSTSVDDGGTHYGFIVWVPNEESAITIMEPTWPSTIARIWDACTLDAQYGIAVGCTLKKSPPEDFGGFVVDGTTYDGIDIYTDWWAVGSSHDIEATSPDTAGGERYVFDHWSDGGAIAHNVGPVADHLTLTAYYQGEYRLHLEKNPWHTEGFLAVDHVSYPDSARVDIWVAPGAAPTIQASAEDYTSAGERYLWTNWSDGGAITHIVEPIYGPVDIIAYYNQQYRLIVAKEPPETLGTITIDDSLYEFVASAERWFSPGPDTHNVWVSRIDFFGDTAYQFIGFDGDPTDTILPKPVVLTVPESLTADYNCFEYVLSFFVNPTEWRLSPPPIPGDYTRTMIPPESIIVENTGNIPIDLGLCMITPDTLTPWSCGCINGINRAVVRGHFNLDPVAPAIFSLVWDCVKETNTWATELYFGPLGWAVPPETHQKLWLQLETPIASSDYTEQTLILRVQARISLY